MTTKTTKQLKPLPPAICFSHRKGFMPTYKHAMTYAGKGGRVATIEDIVASRMANTPASDIWQESFTTMSAEYLGISRGGNRILIVAHGVGPLTKPDAVVRAYQHEQAKGRHSASSPVPTITNKEFWDLESGKYGEVYIIDFDDLCKRTAAEIVRSNLVFRLELSVAEALAEPLVMARLGKNAAEYLQHILKQSRRLHERQSDDPFCKDIRLITLQAVYDSVENWLKEGGEGAFAKLLDIGQLEEKAGYVDEDDDDSPECHYYDVFLSDYYWTDTAHLIGVQASAGDNMPEVYCPPSFENKLFQKYWPMIMEMNPTSKTKKIPFCGLTQIGDQWFTQHPIAGECRDYSGNPEFLVTESTRVHEGEKTFTAFNWSISAIRKTAPARANAYHQYGHTEGGKIRGGVRPDFHFYEVEVDTSHRLPPVNELEDDYATLLQVYGKHYSERKPRKRRGGHFEEEVFVKPRQYWGPFF
jgi:hypothetical protein